MRDPLYGAMPQIDDDRLIWWWQERKYLDRGYVVSRIGFAGLNPFVWLLAAFTHILPNAYRFTGERDQFGNLAQ